MNCLNGNGLFEVLKMILSDVWSSDNKIIKLTGEISTAVNTAYVRTISNINDYDFLIVKIKKDFSAASTAYTGKNESGATQTVNFAGNTATSTDIINPNKDIGRLIQSASFFGIKYGFPTNTKLYISNDDTSAGTLVYEIYGVKIGGQK
ncbi:MAG: hypothetical protein OSJ54_11485 [Oscillospiraceae bacterium]|nr:hypothetical protein [Oscillospiraceae bacterium]